MTAVASLVQVGQAYAFPMQQPCMYLPYCGTEAEACAASIPVAGCALYFVCSIKILQCYSCPCIIVISVVCGRCMNVCASHQKILAVGIKTQEVIIDAVRIVLLNMWEHSPPELAKDGLCVDFEWHAIIPAACSLTTAWKNHLWKKTAPSFWLSLRYEFNARKCWQGHQRHHVCSRGGIVLEFFLLLQLTCNCNRTRQPGVRFSEGVCVAGSAVVFDKN